MRIAFGVLLVLFGLSALDVPAQPKGCCNGSHAR